MSCIDAGIPGIPRNSLNDPILHAVEVWTQLKTSLIHKNTRPKAILEASQESSHLPWPLVLVSGHQFLLLLTGT